MAFKNKGMGTSKLRNNPLMLGLLAALVAVIFVGSLTFLQAVYRTETYYILNTDVPARTQVTPEMLTPITASEGTAPPNAKTIGDVQSGDLFTKTPLLKGDPLSSSTVGGLEDIASGVPDTWVVTTIQVPDENALGGRIQRGYYFDVMVATKTGSYYPFINVLSMGTPVAIDANTAAAEGVSNSSRKASLTTQYTVAGTPGDMAKLQQVMKANSADVKLVLSPRQNQYAAPQVAEYSDGGNVFTYKMGDEPKDLGKGSDYTFSPVKRDAFGRPLAKEATCSQGNGKVDAKTCASASPSASTTTPAPSN